MVNVSLAELWVQHSRAEFPSGYGGEDVRGICVTSLDTYASGCISRYIKKHNNIIDKECYQILQKCIVDLEHILPCLEGDSLVYFSTLHEMCTLIVKEARPI